MFLLLGAWPVFGFFGLDVLLVYSPFRANFREARAYEEVTVTPSELTVRKVSHRGGVGEWTLNPSGRGSTASCTRNSGSSGCSWSRMAGGWRSPAFWGRTRRRASPAHLRPRWASQARADPDGAGIDARIASGECVARSWAIRHFAIRRQKSGGFAAGSDLDGSH